MELGNRTTSTEANQSQTLHYTPNSNRWDTIDSAATNLDANGNTQSLRNMSLNNRGRTTV